MTNMLIWGKKRNSIFWIFGESNLPQLVKGIVIVTDIYEEFADND